MLRLLAVLMSFQAASKASRNAPDPEKGGVTDLDIEETRSTHEYDALGEAYDDEDDELEHEHDSDDIIHDMEVEHGEEDPAPERALRRGRTYSSSLSLIARETRSSWYLKLQELLNPKTTQQDIEAYVPNYRYTPILSGIVIPFSILLEIPGLTEVRIWFCPKNFSHRRSSTGISGLRTTKPSTINPIRGY
jgi:hypothetical protein